MDHRHALVSFLALLALLLLLPKPASAGYAYPNPPSGWGGSPGAWTFGGTPAANADWINGSARANVAVNVGGRSVTMPAAMRMASNAGQFIARAGLTIHPLGRAASYIAWAALAQWSWNEGLQRWERSDTEEGQVNGYVWRPVGESSQAAWSSSPSGACTARIAVLNAAAGFNRWRYQSFVIQTVTQGHCLGDELNANGSVKEANKNFQNMERITAPTGWPGASMRPVTVTDADALAAQHPVPDAVVNDAQKHVPIPQIVPLLNPVPFPGGIPTSIWNPLGEPYSWQEQWRQEGNTIKPANNDTHPWRVDVQPEVKEGENPEDFPDDTSEEPETPPEDEPSECEKSPDTAGCAELDTPDAPEVPNTNINVAITPQGGWGADNAACPADRVTSIGVTVPFSEFCTTLGWLRPVILGFAWLSAAFILLGARSD